MEEQKENEQENLSETVENDTSMESMEELLAQEDLTLDLPKPGDIRTGFVVHRNDDEILVSIGAKSEGVIPGKEVSQLSDEDLEKLAPGQEVTVYVVAREDQHGNVVLSYTRGLEKEDWTSVQELKESSEIFESVISGFNKGGLIVKYGRLRGFVPASQFKPSRRGSQGNTAEQRWGNMVGESIIVRVIEVDQERRRLIFSEKAALQESREIFKERLLAEVSVGDVLEGRVTSLADFGAFVNINGADGLVHLTELSWDRVKHPSEVLKVGEEVNVKIITIDAENKRIGLSIRELLSDPWPQKVEQFKEGQLVQASVVRLTKFGAFARLDNTDLEGLIHVSELSDARVEHPKEVLAEGEELTLRIIRIDTDQRRIGLSVRKVHSAQYSAMDLEMAMEEAASSLAEDAVVEEEPVVEEVEATKEEAVEEAPVEPEVAEEATEEGDGAEEAEDEPSEEDTADEEE